MTTRSSMNPSACTSTVHSGPLDLIAITVLLRQTAEKARESAATLSTELQSPEAVEDLTVDAARAAVDEVVPLVRNWRVIDVEFRDWSGHRAGRREYNGAFFFRPRTRFERV